MAAAVMDYLVEDAKKRQVESGKEYGRGGVKVVETLPQPIKEEPAKKAREQAGKLFNVSGRTVGDAQTVTRQGTEEEIQSVRSGGKSVSVVAKDVRERKKAEPMPLEKQTFNATNDNIEWAKWSWNPVTGCKMAAEIGISGKTYFFFLPGGVDSYFFKRSFTPRK
jgi:hypothetical protein